MSINYPFALFSVLSIAWILVACDPSPQKSADNYYFENKEYEKTSLAIEFVVMPSAKALQKEAEKFIDKETAGKVAAFSRLRPALNSCTIYIIDPEVQYDPEFIGHEVTHCIYGRWHPSQ